MLIRRKTLRQTRTKELCLSRADSIHRWATEGARAYTNIQREPVHIFTGSYTILDSTNWFGANKECAGYTPKATMAILKGQSGAIFRKGVVIGTLSYYHERFHAISINRACKILVDLGCIDDTFYWDRDKWTPRKILQDIHKNNRLARRAVIRFVGGPPDKCRIFKGTLLSMMLDRIAVAILLGGLSAINNVIGTCERYTN